MTSGDTVWTADVFHSDGGPLVFVEERKVKTVLDDGVVCERYGTLSVFPPEKLFESRESATEKAVELAREGLSKITTAYNTAIGRLLTPASSAV
jgi:hypothetical protein